MENLFNVNHLNVLSYWLINSPLPTSTAKVTNEDLFLFQEIIDNLNVYSIYGYILTCKDFQIPYPTVYVIAALRKGYFEFFINQSCELATLPLSKLQYSPKITSIENLIYFLDNVREHHLPITY